ncbi:MAG: type II toxin-antitoxin system PemK/MazF family toxin [Pseudonocardia sediminis]
MRRGEVWTYDPVLGTPGRSRHRLIVSSDAVNVSELPVGLGLLVVDTDPGGLLSVRIGDVGWASALSIEATLRRRLGERVYAASSEEMDAVDAALRAAQDL